MLLWIPLSVHTAVAIYCYPGDPPDVYAACVAYNQGIGQQVSSEQQLQAVMSGIITAEGQINAIIAIIKNLDAQIAAQKDLIAKTQNAIDELDRKIRFTEASLTRLHAQLSVRGEVLNQRLRYVDDHGSVNYVELVLTANTFNDLMNRMIGAQQVAASDRKLMADLCVERAQFDQTSAELVIQRTQVQALLQQLQATEADMEKNQATEKAALVYQQQLENKLSDEYRQLEVQRKAIDAQVAALALKYDAAAAKYGGSTGGVEWPGPACRFRCLRPSHSRVALYLPIYDPSLPSPHRPPTRTVTP